MVTMSTPGATADRVDRPRDPVAFHCQWNEDLAGAGVVPTPSVALNIGVPALALSMLGAALLAAWLAPAPDRGIEPLGIVLLLAACGPWIPWLAHGDDGPSWSFLAFALAPVAALGAGHWFVGPLGLGSDVAYPLLAFPGLLVAILGIAVAPVALAVGFCVGAYLSFGGPLLMAWLAGKEVAATDVVTWHVVLILGVVAGYAVRFSAKANAAVVEAREALAWQAAAEDRRQVARDVHDVVAHTLAVTMLHITAARMAVIRGAPEVAVDALEEAERQGRSSLADIRRVVQLLRSEGRSARDVAEPGLGDIEGLIERYRAAGMAVDLSLIAPSGPLPATTELALYRVLQEALTNAARHGGEEATVELGMREGGLYLRVENPVRRHGPRPSRGNGLTGMRERIAAAGGTIEAGVRGERWVVFATVPGAGAA